MKSQSIILSVLISAMVGLGCGGATPAAEEPASAENGAAESDSMAGDGMGSDMAAASGTDTAGDTADRTAIALGPQVSPGGDVRFNFEPTGRVKKIYLAGSFNAWNPSNDDFLLSDEDGDGIFDITISLKPGVYQYKFVIDGRWTKDPNSPESHPDGFGGQNGKFEVK